MMTDLLSASALPASLALGVSLGVSNDSKQPMVSPPMFSPSNGQTSAATASPSSSSRGLSTPPSQHQSTHSPQSNSSSRHLYRFLKQQLHLPDKLDLLDLSTSPNSSLSANAINNTSSPFDKQGLCSACDLPRYTTFGPYSAKIAKSRQALSNESGALKVSGPGQPTPTRRTLSTDFLSTCITVCLHPLLSLFARLCRLVRHHY